jgi:peptidyl-prolyl cis-trans isomerase C
MKKQFLLRAALALALLPLELSARAAAPDAVSSLFADPVLAKGKGFEITRSSLEEAFVTYKASMAARGQDIPDIQREAIQSNLLEHLIISKILVQKATAEEKLKTKEQIDQAINTARTNAPSEEAFNSQIKATGMTLDQMKERANEEQVCKRVLDREVRDKIKVSDDSIKQFYDDHPKDFDLAEQVRVSHILIATLDPLTQQQLPPDKKKEKEKLINDLRTRAANGEDFAKLAKQYSEDPGSKDKGGEYTFARGRMVPEFEAAAFSLKTNQISSVVETQYGYHIIKLLEKLPATKWQLADASPKIKGFLVEQEFEKQIPDYFKKLETEYDVKLLTPGAAAPDTKAKAADSPGGK